MKNDSVLEEFNKLAQNSSNNAFAKTLQNIVKAMEISLQTSADKAIDFLSDTYPYTGSISKEAQVKRQNSILQYAWKGIDNTVGVNLLLNNEQRNKLFLCFKITTKLATYSNNFRNNFVTFQFFKSNLIKFTIKTEENRPDQLVIFGKPITNSESNQKIKDFTEKFQTLGTDFIQL